jgi:succinyl-CoA synthetase alpha subunit
MQLSGLSRFVPEEVRVVVQGITGRQGSFHTKQMLDYGTKIVAGVTPGKGGQEVHGVPVFDTVREAVEETGANTSIIFVPARFAYDAVVEAIYNGLNPIVVITEGIPAADTIRFLRVAKSYNARIIGPNCPGFIIPGFTKVGIMPNQYFKPGNITVISRSGTLTYEIAWNILKVGYGHRLVVGVGGDYVIGTNFVEFFDEIVKYDEYTDAVIVIGEIGGDDEERLAEYLVDSGFDKPVIGYIAGKTAPPGKRMGHAGAIISGSSGTAEAKIKSLKEAGVYIAYKPSDIPDILRRLGI